MIDHRKLPRKKRIPSPRDQAMYLARLTHGVTQEELAKEHRLSQSRVSQILRRVAKWWANLRPEPEGELAPEERQRLERWLERERQQAIYDRGIRGFDSAAKQLTTTKSGERGDTKYS